MKTLYIKFRHPEDVYAIYPDYDLSPDDFVPPKVCGRCGDNLYIPVEIPDDVTIVQSRGEVIRPFPKEKPDYIIREIEPEPITMEFTSKDKLSYSEQQRLKSFFGVAYVGEEGFSLLIDGCSKERVKHICNLGV